jgi:hypothetical protein
LTNCRDCVLLNTPDVWEIFFKEIKGKPKTTGYTPTAAMALGKYNDEQRQSRTPYLPYRASCGSSKRPMKKYPILINHEFRALMSMDKVSV